jgi:hypothetical protein
LADCTKGIEYKWKVTAYFCRAILGFKCTAICATRKSHKTMKFSVSNFFDTDFGID